jgi:pSer/pThr/pTyr-binding forkhead associated (FHA) protein
MPSPVTPPAPPHSREPEAVPAAGAAPVPEGVAVLTLFPPDGSPRRIEVAGVLLVGRDETCGLCLADDPFVSPRHAQLSVERGLLVVEDVDSLNGVFCRIRKSATIEDGDRIRIGSHVFRFELVERGEAEKLDVTMSLIDPSTRVQGTPGEEVLARLVVRLDSGERGKEYHLGRSTAILGRGRGTHNFLSDAEISARHASISFEHGRFVLRDLKSETGTWLLAREPEFVPPGAEFRIGHHRFRVEQ